MSDTSIGQASETQENTRYILLKTEKLSVALHMVTAHLSLREPLREDLRRLSLVLLKDVRGMLSNESGRPVSETSHMIESIESIVSSLYLAKMSKLVGEGNVGILEREYAELIGYFRFRGEIDLVADITTVPRHGGTVVDSSEAVTRRVKDRDRDKDIGHSPMSGVGSMSFRHNQIADGQSSRPVVPTVGKSNITVRSSNNFLTTESGIVDGSARRVMILNIIEPKRSYSLGEIASDIKGVSEKTIQRDLLALVADKTLKKTGERRWSRYMRA